MAREDFLTGEVVELGSRKISEDTCQHFGYLKGRYNGKLVHIAPYFDEDGNLVAQHLRTKGKEFPWVGQPKKALPFGSQLWAKTGRKIVVTEGEIDCMTMSQCQNNKWPVVSIGCGAGPQIKKYAAQHRDYFLGFEEVIVMFDMDEPGRKAAKEFAEVIGKRAKIADLPLKDPSDMLVAGRAEDLINAMWKAKTYRPDGIVDLKSLREQVLRGVEQGIPWPWETLTKLTFGRRTGEIYCIGAGTGIGKTDFLTEIIVQTAVELEEPCGVFFLEQEPSETAMRLAGKLASRRFHIPDSGWSRDELTETWDRLEQCKIFLYDSFGTCDYELIENRIRFLVHTEGVKHIFLDHLTALAAWQDDERKALELIMSSLGGLVKELDICLYLVSHLATPDGKPHEEGGRVMIRHFKGSRAIGFWCHYMIGLERDQQLEDETQRHLTTVRILKDRYTGNATGQTFDLKYDQETGQLEEYCPDAVVFDRDAEDTDTDF